MPSLVPSLLLVAIFLARKGLVFLVEKLGIPKVMWPWCKITYIQNSYNAQKCLSLPPLTECDWNANVSNPRALKTSCQQNNVTIQVTTAMLLLLGAENGNL